MKPELRGKNSPTADFEVLPRCVCLDSSRYVEHAPGDYRTPASSVPGQETGEAKATTPRSREATGSMKRKEGVTGSKIHQRDPIPHMVDQCGARP